MADLKLVLVFNDTTTKTITVPDAKNNITRSQNLTPYYETLKAVYSDFATIKSAYYENIERTDIKSNI
ncbi:MAG: hypothetical protein IJ563_01620 [Selenomonadaceae bacterium]|nr:hypothetical protein [Selenomonadaceae bacterium]